MAGVFMLFQTSLDQGHLGLRQAGELSYFPSLQNSQVNMSFVRLGFLSVFGFYIWVMLASWVLDLFPLLLFSGVYFRELV